MTGLRIKILKSGGQPAGLGIRLKRWFSRIAAWFQVSEGQTPPARGPELKIRVLSNGGPPTAPTPTANVPRPGGIVVSEGERKCKTCGGALFNGGELTECSANPAHKIHASCVELAGHKCPDCQASLGSSED